MTPQRCREILRLLQAYAEGKEVQERDFTIAFHEKRDWKPFVFEHLTEACYEYRIKPTPKRVPWTASDVPPVCWLRVKGTVDVSMVVAIEKECVRCQSIAGLMRCPWSALERDMEHSPDLKTWHPCSKEVTP